MTLQERLMSELKQKLEKDLELKDGQELAAYIITPEEINQIIQHTIEQTIKEVQEVLQTHEEGDKSRSECDADGLTIKTVYRKKLQLLEHLTVKLIGT